MPAPQRWLFALLCVALTAPCGAQTLDDLYWQRHLDRALTVIAKRWPAASAAERQRLAVLRADCYIQLHQLDQAARALAEIPRGSQDPRFYRVQGELSHLNGNDRLARQSYAQAIALHDGAEAISSGLDLVELELGQNHLEEARKAWSAALEQAVALPVRPELWVGLYQHRVDILSAGGQKEEALDVCRMAEAYFKAIHYRAGLGGIRFSEARIYQDLGQYARADAAWQSAAELESNSAAAFLVWGYNLIFARQDATRIERWLVLSQRMPVAGLAPYEHFHLRLLQGLASLFGLGRPAQAEQFLKQAEPLASPIYRAAGDHLTIQLQINQYGPRDLSELSQVLYLRLLCQRYSRAPEAQMQAFMRSRIERLAPKERGPWLIMLGRSYLSTRDWPQADSAIAQALTLVTGEQQARMILGAFEAELEAGRLSAARQLGDRLEQSLTDDDTAVSRVVHALERYQVDLEHPLWEAGGDARVIAHELAERILDGRGRRARLEAQTAARLDATEAADNQTDLEEELFARAWHLAAEQRWSEALIACQDASQLAEQLQQPKLQASYGNLLGFLEFQVGEREAGIATVAATEKSADPSEALHRQALHRELELRALDAKAVRDAPIGTDNPSELFFGRARADLLLGDPSAALSDLSHCTVNGTVYAFPVQLLRARALERLNRHAEALALVQQTATEAHAAGSLFEAEALARAPLASPGGPVWMNGRDFQARLTGWLKDFPDLMESVPVLPGTLASQADQLAPDRALVEYYLGKHELVILAATREGFLLRRLEVGRARIAAWAAELRSAPTGEGSRNLHRMLIDPIESELRGNTLTLIASTTLVSLPWDLLQSTSGKSLLEEHSWSLWSPGGGHPGIASHEVLAIGDVQNANLPATKLEIEAIRHAFPDLQALMAGAATLPRFISALPHADVVHLATHGHADPHPADSWIQLSDGRLRAEQIYSLPLKPGALVVLSTCQSADPELQQRAPVTLGAAFLSAGASHVIGSLTPVGDEETAALFGDFYRQLALGQSAGEALRNAKMMEKARSSSLDWSSFILLSGF